MLEEKPRMKLSHLFRNKNFRGLLIFLFSLLCGYLTCTLPLEGLGQAGRISLGIFVVAVLLWVTEAIPIFITSSVIVILEVIFLGRPEGPLHLEKGGYEIFLNSFSSSIILLLLGGFALALAVQKHWLGNMLAVAIIKRMGNKPVKVLLGAMLTTGFLSMWISNTAATASMIVVILPILKLLDHDDPFRKALLLGIPFSSSIGGMGTPIGTPPNAIAVGLLQRMGFEITFLRWMILVVPIAVVVMYFAWRILIRLFPCKVSAIDFNVKDERTLNNRQKLVLIFAMLTVLLWLTEPIHHIPTAIVALFPLVVFFGFGFLEKKDFEELGWNVLIIVGGGIALGVGMERSGLTSWMADRLSLEGLPLILSFLLFGLVTMGMSTFISNSAVANLFLPIALGFAMFSPRSIALCVALSASLAMALPISTPPNAIAYGSGELEMRDMIKAGAVIAGVGVVVVSVYVFVLSKLVF
jgi:sodium-dependent dicarboxylate transporter 2/3/5